jgi:hypothetical protein
VHTSPFYETPPTSIFAPYVILQQPQQPQSQQLERRRALASWGSFTVTAAQVLLMREALKEPQNLMFAFLSEKVWLFVCVVVCLFGVLSGCVR